MKRILDSDFRYRPSFETDLKKTFERIRREQQARDKREKPLPSEPSGDAQPNIVKLDRFKRGGGRS